LGPEEGFGLEKGKTGRVGRKSKERGREMVKGRIDFCHLLFYN